MSTKNSIPRVYSIFLILVFMLALAFSVLDFMPVHAAGILYTKPAASGTGDCSSWANACTLQSALTGALSGDEIWTATGTYIPGTLRTDTFQLIDGVALYGGFAGTETALDQSNPATNATILSGEIDAAGNSDNSYHIVTGATGATLDGFTITAGNANGVNPNDRGGGMYNDSSSPTLTNVTFSGNSATFGGGMYNHSNSPTVAKITFSGNSAVFGGGIYNDSSSPVLTNITFIGNSAVDWGGGMGNYSSNPTLTNITFKGNSAQLGGGIGNFFNSSLQVRNTILWGNTAATAGTQIYNDSSTPVVSDSVVQGGYAGGTNIITTDPLLGTLGNYGGSTQTIPLLPGSSAIGRGNDATCASTDQRGVARPQGAHCDTGAFEYDYTGIYYVKPVASGTENCQSWENACTLQNALTTAIIGDEIWAAAGTYKPTMGTDRLATFQLKSGVALYGGFAGSETARDQRNPATNLTFLSGDIDNNDSQTPIITDLITVTGNTTNSYHVVTGATGATLDGFTITAGYANGVNPYDSGGGMYSSSSTLSNVTFSGNLATGSGGGMYNAGSSPTLTNVTFSGNSAGYGGGMISIGQSYGSHKPILTNVTFDGNSAQQGGGMYLGGGTKYSYQNPTLTNISFSGNMATNDGGGIYNVSTMYTSSAPTLTNVTFRGNSAENGGGMHNVNSGSSLMNVTFSGNSATNEGGGMFNLVEDYGVGMHVDSPTLTNVTFSSNSAQQGGGMYGGSPQIRNTILWGNMASTAGAQIYNDASSSPAVSDSVVQDGYAGGMNIIIADPRLGTLGNYGGLTQTIPLLVGSSAIHTGNDAVCPTTDQRGVARPQGAHCDIGAYEYDYTGIYYVKPVTSGTGNCQSWDNACILQNALTTTNSGDEIWAAAGMYKPTTGTDRLTTFQLKNGVALYGGFAGTETTRDQRNFSTNVTILSGDLNGDDEGFTNNSENVYHVVTGASNLTLDGFTITAGNANGGIPNGGGGGMYNVGSAVLTNLTFISNSAQLGGGMYNGGCSNYINCNPMLTNVTFIGNSAQHGGGMYNISGNDSDSNPMLTNVRFNGNSAQYGGGMYNRSGMSRSYINPVLTTVTFSGNSAESGGGMYNFTEDLCWLCTSFSTLTNVTFSNNTAVDFGGGMYNHQSHQMLTNVTFSGNSSQQGGGMYNDFSDGGIRNTILWGNSAPEGGAQIYNVGSIPGVSDSVVQDGFAGGTNIITADPLLGILGNYGGSTQTIPLLAGSSAINTGNDTICPDTDQRGIIRPQGAHCDIGAFEFVETTAVFTIFLPLILR